MVDLFMCSMQGLIKSAAKEFQDELKKLGIYEGTD